MNWLILRNFWSTKIKILIPKETPSTKEDSKIPEMRSLGI